jgi:hypothetical protein
MSQVLALSSSAGDFDIAVPADDFELIASMLILLGVTEQSARKLYAVPDQSNAA